MDYEELARRVKKMNAIVQKQNEQRKKLPDKQQWKQTLDTIEWLLGEHLKDKEARSRAIKEALALAKARGQKLGGRRGARRKPKVPLDVLRALDKEGWTQTKIAQKFGISQGWVSQQLKKGRKTK